MNTNNNGEKFAAIRAVQKEFQRMVDFPVDSMSAADRDEMSEKYLFKAIEEIVELRKEFPSVMNPWSRTQRQIENLDDIKAEFADVYLFLMNFLNVWKISDDEILDAIMAKQEKNFLHIKTKKMNILNSELGKIPGGNVQPGSGSLLPDTIFIAKTPDDMFEYCQQEKVNEDGNINYYTTLVKQHGITEVDETATAFWQEFLDRELEILKTHNPDVLITYV